MNRLRSSPTASCFTKVLVTLVLLSSIQMAVGLEVNESKDFDFARAMYGPWNYEEMGNFSFEADYHNSWWHHSGRERILDMFAEKSLEAEANNVTFVGGLYYHAAPWDRLDFEYVHAVHESGFVEPYTPSPIDETWWERTMHEPAIAVANLSLYYPIWGLVWDIELYGHGAILRDDYSYDLPAIHAFANATGITIPPMGKSEGFFYLQREGLLEPFHAWMGEVMFAMAKRTGDAVHAINPGFNLGLLGTEDSWHHWTILRAFNCSTASVTSWGEQTYGGYVEEKVEFYQEKFEELGLNGKYVPGVRPAASLGKFIYDLGLAVRHNGVFWIYQHNGDPWSYTSKSNYVRMYQIFDQFVFFNGSEVYPLPEFDLMPGAGVHPYLGPGESTSILVYTKLQDKPFEKELLPMGFEVVTEADEVVYIGENLTEKRLPGPGLHLEPEDLPCILYGLGPEDLSATEATALHREFVMLVDLFQEAGIGTPAYAQDLLSEVASDLNAGNYLYARERLMGYRNDTYGFAFEAVQPLIDEGFSNPRDSEIPLSILRALNDAGIKMGRGETRLGELGLIDGLRQLSEVVESSFCLVFLPFAVFLREKYQGRNAG